MPRHNSLICELPFDNLLLLVCHPSTKFGALCAITITLPSAKLFYPSLSLCHQFICWIGTFKDMLPILVKKLVIYILIRGN